MECDNLYGWIKKTVAYAKISPKMVSPRDIDGNTEEEEEKKKEEKDPSNVQLHMCQQRLVGGWLLNIPAIC